MLPSRSRLPRSTSTPTNENALPPSSTHSSLTGKPASGSTRSRMPSASSLLVKNASTARQATRPLAANTSAAEPEEPTPAFASLTELAVAVQAPSSDPPIEAIGQGFADEQQDGAENEQMPTPPGSLSPPSNPATAKKCVRAAESSKTRVPVASRIPRTRSQTSTSSSSASSLAPPPPKPRRSSRSPSAQAADIPVGPSHAPHVLAARRRSSVSPLPPASSQHAPAKPVASSARLASPAAPSPAPVPVIIAPILPNPLARSTQAASKSLRRTKLRARPSETLPEPIVLGSSDDEVDPLLLLGPEETRGRGEGKGKVMGRKGRRGTPVPARGLLVRRESKVEEPSVKEQVKDESVELEDQPVQHMSASDTQGGGIEPELQQEAEQEEEEEYGGGFDGGDQFFNNEDDLHDLLPPPAPCSYVTGLLQSPDRAQSELRSFEQYGQTDGFAPLQDPDSGTEVDPAEFSERDAESQVEHEQEQVEMDQAEVEPAPATQEETEEKVVAEQHEQFTNPARHFSSVADLPQGTDGNDPVQTARTPSPAFTDEEEENPSALLPASSPPLPQEQQQSYRRSRPSYPPLSAEESGEWDSTVPVRLDSSPVRGSSVERGSPEEDSEDEAVDDSEAEEEGEEESQHAKLQATEPVAEQQQQLALSAQEPTHRSPSPAVRSPFFRRPSRVLVSTPGSAAPDSAPRRSTPALSFASPRLPRERYPHLNLPSPAAPPIPSTSANSNSISAAAALASSTRSWTRGPAFFRSSSFSPPPHADQPRTATLFSRRPGRYGSGGAPATAEKSRDDYHRFAELTPSSPFAEERREVKEEEGEEEEEEQVVLVGQEEQALERARTASASPPWVSTGQGEEEEQAPPTPAKDHDIRMSSPVASLRGSPSPPPRSPGGENTLMSSSPAASPIHSRAPSHAHSHSPSPASKPNTQKRLPATPSAAAAHEVDEDSRMGSPSSMKGRKSIVEQGRERLQGLLFGPRSFTREEKGKGRAVDQDDEAVEEPQEPQPESEEDEEDEDDQPFPAPYLHAGPAAAQPLSAVEPPAPESTFSISQPMSKGSLASTSSRRRKSSHHHRRRPSHPTLPVVEISSTDPKAAARAAAILKCYHDYIEQGVEAVDPVTGEKSVAVLDADEEQEGEEEEELRTLLLDAEDEVRSMLPPPPRPATARGTHPRKSNPSEAEVEDEEAELSTSTARTASPPPLPTSTLPPPPRPAPPASASSRRQRQPSGTLSSVVNTATWTSSEWRRLEQTLVEVGRRQRREESVSSAATDGQGKDDESIASFASVVSAVGEEVEPEVVVEAFLTKWGVQKEELGGQWDWDTLIVRVNALKARRAKDHRLKRASSLASDVSTSTSMYNRAPLPPRQNQPQKQERRLETLDEELRRASSPAAEEEEERIEGEDDEEEQEEHSAAPAADAQVQVKDEQLSEHGGYEQAGGDVTSSDEEDEPARRAADDTFFAVSTKDRRRRRTSVQPVYLPTALANPRLRHLYEDAPAPEKPRVPVRDYLRDESPEAVAQQEEEEEEVEERPRDAVTPEQEDGREPSQPPSSAQRLFSYIGSFVRRSPAPEPSPSSSRVAMPASFSVTPEPEPSPVPEMQEAGLRGPVFTPRIDKPLPHLDDRKILPLPPLHFPSSQSTPGDATAVASTSRQTLDDESSFASTSSSSSSFGPFSRTPRLAPQPHRRIRRRSSEGEHSRVWEVVNAIEEAESSREEEEARIVSLLQSGGAKRRAVGGDLRTRAEVETGGTRLKGKGKGRAVEQEDEDEDEGTAGVGGWRGFVEIDRDLGRGMVPTGTRALDRRPSGELRRTLQ